MMRAVKLAMVVALVSSVAPAFGQTTSPFAQAISELGSGDASVRHRAAQALKQGAPDDAALPLVPAIGDAEDAVQLEAIAAEVNIFLVEKVVTRKRVALLIEVRNQISAEAVFSEGPSVIDTRPVPAEVLTALRAATHDENARVALEALYAFGALSVNVSGKERDALLAASAADLGAALGVPSADVRMGAIRVITRLYAWRPGDRDVDPAVGDALVTTLNDPDSSIRLAAMDAIGALRYVRSLQAMTDLFVFYKRGPDAVASLSALARIGHPAAATLFATTLGSHDAPLRVASIQGLARTGNPAQASLISEAVAPDKNDEVRLAGHYAAAMLSNGPLDAVVDALSRPRLHDVALQYLIDLAPGRVAQLAPLAQAQDARLRVDVFEALGLSGDAAALPIALASTQDGDPAVARAAARAVGRLRAAAAR
jgi:HEAT repeat protein